MKCFKLTATSSFKVSFKSQYHQPNIAETVLQHWFVGERNHLLNQWDHSRNILILQEKENSHRILKTIGPAASCWGKLDNNGLWFKNSCKNSLSFFRKSKKTRTILLKFHLIFFHCIYEIRFMMWVFVSAV